MATKKKVLDKAQQKLKHLDGQNADVLKDSGQARMTKANVNKYELLAIYPLGENEIACEKSLAEMVKKNGFAITEVDKWGVKNLAYTIKKETKGYYLRFVIENGDTKGLEKELSFDDKMLRYILVKI